MRNESSYSRCRSSCVASLLLAVAATLAVTACAFEADEVVPSPGSTEALDTAESISSHDAVDDGELRAAPTSVELQPGVAVPDLAAATRVSLSFHLVVPEGATNLVVRTSGGTGDADLYVRRDGESRSRSSTNNGNDDQVRIAVPVAGTYRVTVRAYSAFAGATLVARYDLPAPPPDAGVPPVPEPDAAPGTGPDCRDAASWPAEWTAYEDEVLVRINVARAAGATCGATAFPPVGPLTMSGQLRQAARCHSLDMAVHDYFSHTSQDGRTPWQRIEETGYQWRNAAENIAAGYGTAQAAVDGWLRSTGHCENLMNGQLTETGVGYGFDASSTYDRYWTQTFGRPR